MKPAKKKDGNSIICVLTNLFLIVLLGIYPLFESGSYSDLLQVKTGFLYLVMAFFFGAVFFVILIQKISHGMLKQKKNARAHFSKRNWNITDWLVFGFLLVSLISWLLHDHKKELFWGIYGRNVGLLIIVACGMTYFLCSRYGEMTQSVIITMLAAMTLVSVIAICNHLGMDILQMYENMKVRKTFLSTIGNLTVLTSYLSCILPIAMGLFWIAEEILSKIVYGAVSFVGFLGLLAVGTDSAYIIVGMLLILILVLTKQSEKGVKWCILCGEWFLAIIILRILRYCAGKRCVKLTSVLTKFIMKSQWSLVGAAVLLLFSVMFLFIVLKGENNWKRIRKGLLIVIGIGMGAILAAMIVLNFFVDETIAKSAFGGLGRYLYLDNTWGTRRMQIWKLGLKVFGKMSLAEKCIGYGPSGFFFALQEYLTAADLSEVTVKGILVDAHSMYLQVLIGQGVAGLLCYVFIFLSLIYKCKFIWKAEKEVLIYFVWISSFFLQGMVNNIHIYTEPIYFALLGVWMKTLYSKEL